MYTKEDLRNAFTAGNKRGWSGYPDTDNHTKPTFDQWHEKEFPENRLKGMAIIGIDVNKSGSELARAVMHLQESHNVVLVVDNETKQGEINNPYGSIKDKIKELGESLPRVIKVSTIQPEPTDERFKGFKKKSFNGIKQPKSQSRTQRRKGKLL